MTTKRVSLMLLGFVAALVAGTYGLALAGEGEQEEGDLDIVKRADDVPVPPMKITKDDYKSVEGVKGKLKLPAVPGWAVKEVFYADRDPVYSTAIEKRDSGNYVTALKGFRIALEKMPDKKWAPEYCNFGMGEALYQDNRFSEPYVDRQGVKYRMPSEYFREVIKANPKSRFLLEAHVKLAISLAEEGKMDEAQAAFVEADTAIKAYKDEMFKVDAKYRDISEKYTVMAVMGNARMLEKKADGQGDNADYNPAKSKFGTAQSASTGKYPEVYAEAVDGELRVLTKMKDFTSANICAQSILDQFKQKPEPELYRMLPGAHAVKGMSNYNQALEAKKSNQAVQANKLFAEARWDFLHIVVKFFDNDDYLAQAHFFVGKCYAELKNEESDAMVKAVRHWKAVVENFPNSKFKPLAEDELKSADTAPAAPKEEPKKTGEKPKDAGKTGDKPKDAAK